MRKINYMLLFVVSLLTYTVVYASDVSIKKIELVDKDEDAEVLQDVTSDNLSLNIDLKFYNTGDYAKYKIIIQNNSEEDYVISNKETFDENNLIKYEFIFDKNDNNLKAKSTKTFYLNVSYYKEIDNTILNNNSNYKLSNKVEILLEKELPTIVETVKELIENPNTVDLILIIIITLILSITISYILIKYKKSRYVVLLLLLILPFRSRAVEVITININGNIELIKTRMAYNCMSASYEEGTFCIDFNNYVPYDSYDKTSFYLFTTNTNDLPNKYEYENKTYNLDETYDISDLQNGQVMLGVYYDEEGIALMLIGQDVDINAPIDMSALFYGKNNRENSENILLYAKYIDLEYFDTNDVTNMAHTFYSDESLEKINLKSFDTSNVTNMRGMFWNCFSLPSIDVSTLETSNVEDFSFMFATKNNSMSLEEIKGIGEMDVSKAVNMSGIFQNCANLKELDLRNWAVDNATDMSYLFNRCSSLILLDITTWNTENVTNMSYMFYECSSLTNLDVSNFNTSKVTNMSFLFDGCISLEELDLRKWDTSQVTSMRSMFSSNSIGYYVFMNLKEIKGIENFDTSKVTNMSYLFFGNTYIEEMDLSGWDTSNVTTMRSIFTRCKSLKSLNISNWDVSKVTDFFDGFRETNFVELNLSNWHPDSMQVSNRMFNNIHTLHKLDVRNFDFTIVPEAWDNYAYTFNGRYDNIEIIVKDQANKDWIINHRFGITEDNITIAS